MSEQEESGRSKSDRGMTLLMVAASMTVLLGFSALAIDMGAYYLARSEAQRTADAAALAGAGVFVTTSCTDSGTNACGSSTVETAATSEAISVGDQNLVGGQSPALVTGDVSFDVSNATDPRITVTVQRTKAHGNPMPTFFAKIFGFTSVDVSASATAEAYNPSGSLFGPGVGLNCVKPWILPNCDPNHTLPANPNCPGSAYYLDPLTGAVSNPGPVSQGGIIGQAVTLKSGSPQSSAVPSQYYAVEICVGSTSSVLCPNCAGSVSTGCNGANVYQENIECCNDLTLLLGSNQTIDLNLKSGNMQGPTTNGVMCLTHETSSSTGQDTLCGTSVLGPGVNASCAPNFTFYGGSSNPNAALTGKQITHSDSIVTVPVYDGHTLCPGGSCGNSITVIGFLQVFINQVVPSSSGPNPMGTVYATIMNGVSTSVLSGSGSVSGGGVSAIPVRLVQGT